jgi:hypothetical protein
MKSYREELTFETKTRRAYINITPQVEAALRKSGVKEGLCLVNRTIQDRHYRNMCPIEQFLSLEWGIFQK